MKFLNPVSENLLFKGRKNDPRLGSWVKIQFPTLADVSKRNTVCLFGSPDDTGVLLNHGRMGAKDGPDSIRKHFYKMTLPMNQDWEKKFTLYDAGNILVDKEILTTHQRSRDCCRQIGETGSQLIALGGGHDFAAPHFLGFVEGFKKLKPKGSFGLINIDPHLDVRELENERPHSGTPFREILESGLITGKNFVEFGTRANRNSRRHYQYVQSKKVSVLTFEELRRKKQNAFQSFKTVLTQLSKRCTDVGLTIDLDSCSSAEGTSAAPVLGFSTEELTEIAYYAGSHKQIRYFELAECAPSLELSERSSRIAAEMLYAYLSGLAK